MRIVIEIKRDAVGEVVLNNLYSLTQLQVTFGINMVALSQGQPKLLNLKDILVAFVRHRREVVTRRTILNCVKHVIAPISLKRWRLHWLTLIRLSN